MKRLYVVLFFAISTLAQAHDFDCIVMGDSIAEGVARFATQCHSASKVGISSDGWLKMWPRLPNARNILISLGTNDKNLQITQAALATIRRRIVSPRVMRIAPSPSFVGRSAVLEVANSFGDVVYERPEQHLARDGIHYNSDGYKVIASVIQKQ